MGSCFSQPFLRGASTVVSLLPAIMIQNDLIKEVENEPQSYSIHRPEPAKTTAKNNLHGIIYK